MTRGVVFALTAYLMWGMFPLYFKQVQSVPPLEVLANRMLWSMPGATAARRSWPGCCSPDRSPPCP